MRAFALALSLLFICHTCQSASALVQNVDSTPEVENRFFLDIVATWSVVPEGWVGSNVSEHCSWVGVTCESGLVTQISAQELRAMGKIPETVGLLSNLQSINLKGNALSGTIPASLFQLPNITEVALHDNQLEGPIPDTIQYATGLVNLVLYDNFLGPNISDHVADSNVLNYLELSRNRFTCPSAKLIQRLESHPLLPSCSLEGNVWDADEFQACGGRFPPVGRGCRYHPSGLNIPASAPVSATYVFQSKSVRVEIKGRRMFFFPLIEGSGLPYKDEFAGFEFQSLYDYSVTGKVSYRVLEFQPFTEPAVQLGPLSWRIPNLFADGTLFSLFIDLNSTGLEDSTKWSMEVSNFNFTNVVNTTEFIVGFSVLQKAPFNVNQFTCPERIPLGCTDGETRIHLEFDKLYPDVDALVDTVSYIVSTARQIQRIVLPGVYYIDDSPMLVWEGYREKTFLVPYGPTYYYVDPDTGAKTGRTAVEVDRNTTILSYIVGLRIHRFNDTFRYDPDIRFELLFDALDPEDPANVAGIAVGITIPVAIVIGALAVVFGVPRVRARVMPFFKREHASSAHIASSSSSSSSQQALVTDAQRSDWQQAQPERGVRNA